MLGVCGFMSEQHDKQCTTVKAKAIHAWFDGLSRNDNPYMITTKLGRRWARVWLDGFKQAEQGITCDTCGKILVKKTLHIEYSNGFNYFYCNKCVVNERITVVTQDCIST